MNPYLPPASALALAVEPLDLVRLGRNTGVLTAKIYVLAMSSWVCLVFQVSGPFLLVHGGVATLALTPSAAWGGGFLARRSGGDWLHWCGAVACAAFTCLLAGDLGLLLSSWMLDLTRGSHLFGGFWLIANPREQVNLLSYGFLVATAVTASAGLFIRHHAQKQGAKARR